MLVFEKIHYSLLPSLLSSLSSLLSSMTLTAVNILLLPIHIIVLIRTIECFICLLGNHMIPSMFRYQNCTKKHDWMRHFPPYHPHVRRIDAPLRHRRKDFQRTCTEKVENRINDRRRQQQQVRDTYLTRRMWRDKKTHKSKMKDSDHTNRKWRFLKKENIPNSRTQKSDINRKKKEENNQIRTRKKLYKKIHWKNEQKEREEHKLSGCASEIGHQQPDSTLRQISTIGDGSFLAKETILSLLNSWNSPKLAFDGLLTIHLHAKGQKSNSSKRRNNPDSTNGTHGSWGVNSFEERSFPQDVQIRKVFRICQAFRVLSLQTYSRSWLVSLCASQMLMHWTESQLPVLRVNRPTWKKCYLGASTELFASPHPPFLLHLRPVVRDHP